MAAVTLSEKGQIVIPLEIRERYKLTAGTQVEFAGEGGAIRLVVRRRVTPAVPAAGFGLVRANPARKGVGRKLSDFDVTTLVRNKGGA